MKDKRTMERRKTSAQQAVWRNGGGSDSPSGSDLVNRQ